MIGTLVFRCGRFWRNSNGVAPNAGSKYRRGK